MKMRRSTGKSLVETSLILAAFMALLLGMVLAGQTLFIRQTLAERAQEAARWGAMNAYDPEPVRNLVLYGKAQPEQGATPFLGLTAGEVVVTNPGCPGVECRIRVAIPSQGVRSTEPAEFRGGATGGAPSKP